MKREGKIRIAVFIVICIILSYFAIGYVYELYQLDVESIMVDTEQIHNVNIDGSDFTPIFKLFGVGINGLLLFIMTGAYALIILLAGLILLIPFCLIGLNKNRHVEQKEYGIVKRAYIIILILSVLIGGIATRFSLIIPLVLFNAIWAFMVFIFCVIPMILKQKRGMYETITSRS